MSIIKNSVGFGSGFNIRAVGPIDSRMRVQFKDDLTRVWDVEAPAYAGMIVTVLEENKIYVLKNNGFDEKTGQPIASDYTKIDSWFCISENNGASSIDEAAISGIVNNILTEGEYINEGTLAEELAKIEVPITGITYSGTSLNVEDKNVDLSQYFYDKSNIDTLISGVTGQIENIEEQISNFELFNLVNSLPNPDEEEISFNKIYVVLSEESTDGNVYSEYIYVNNNWEKIGEIKTNIDINPSDYYTTGETYSKEEVYSKEETYSKDEVYTTGQTYNKSEVDSKLNTNTITLSEHIKDNEDDVEPVYYSGRTVQEILKDLSLRIKNINAGGSGNAVSIEPGEGINITEEETGSKKISVAISNAEGNAISATTDGSLYVRNLEDRLALLETLLSPFTGENAAEFVTSKNIANHAVTSISYANSTDDIKINGTTGAVTLELDSITNIAYGDAEPINKVEEF